MHWSEFRWYDWLFWIVAFVSWLSLSRSITNLEGQIAALMELLHEKARGASVAEAIDRLQRQIDELKPPPQPPVDGYTNYLLNRDRPP